MDPYQDDHGGSRDPNRSPPHWRIDPEHDEIHPLLSQRADPVEDAIDTRVEGDIDGSPGQNGDAWTRLRESYNRGLEHGVKNDNHGTFTPGPTMKRGTMSFDSQYSFGAARSSIAGKPNDDNTVGGGTASDSLLRSENGGKNMSTTQWLAHRHGIQNQKRMYVSYFAFTGPHCSCSKAKLLTRTCGSTQVFGVLYSFFQLDNSVPMVLSER